MSNRLPTNVRQDPKTRRALAKTNSQVTTLISDSADIAALLEGLVPDQVLFGGAATGVTDAIDQDAELAWDTIGKVLGIAGDLVVGSTVAGRNDGQITVDLDVENDIGVFGTADEYPSVHIRDFLNHTASVISFDSYVTDAGAWVSSTATGNAQWINNGGFYTLRTAEGVSAGSTISSPVSAITVGCAEGDVTLAKNLTVTGKSSIGGLADEIQLGVLGYSGQSLNIVEIGTDGPNNVLSVAADGSVIINESWTDDADFIIYDTSGLELARADASAGVFRTLNLNLDGQAFFQVATAPLITSDQNDYTGNNNTIIARLSSDASWAITGLGSMGTGKFGIDVNVGSNLITLKHENSGSSEANRFHMPDSQDIILSPDDAALRFYDPTTQRVRTYKLGGVVGSVSRNITQASHGFTVGKIVRLSGTSYVAAQADSEANAEVAGIVAAVPDTNSFRLVTHGHVTGLTGLTAGAVSFLSESSAGALTETEPTADGDVSKPLLVADTTTSGYFINMRGMVIESPSGTYSPTRSAEANMDGNVSLTTAKYYRLGDIVTVSGRFTADPTLTATATSFEMTLPVASNLAAAEDVSGTAFCGSIAGQGAEIIGVAANDTAKVQWISGDITSQTWSYMFSYRVI